MVLYWVVFFRLFLKEIKRYLLIFCKNKILFCDKYVYYVFFKIDVYFLFKLCFDLLVICCKNFWRKFICKINC